MGVYDHNNSGRDDSLKDGDLFMYYSIGILKSLYDLEITPYTDTYHQFNVGESDECYEFKLDYWCLRYSHLSIEFAKKHNIYSPWRPGGIMRNDNTIWYVQGNRDMFWVFQKELLKYWYTKMGKPAKNGIVYFGHHQKPTVDTFYVPLEIANKYCVYRFPPL